MHRFFQIFKCTCREWIVRKKKTCTIPETNMEGNEMTKKKNQKHCNMKNNIKNERIEQTDCN